MNRMRAKYPYNLLNIKKKKEKKSRQKQYKFFAKQSYKWGTSETNLEKKTGKHHFSLFLFDRRKVSSH